MVPVQRGSGEPKGIAMGTVEHTVWRRRAAELGFWVLLIGTLWSLDTLTKFGERSRIGVGLDDFRLVAEQATSALAALVMVGFVAAWLNRFPLLKARPIPTALGHLLGSGLFAVGHYGLQVLLRVLIYPLGGLRHIYWSNPVGNLIVEYQKDVKIYVGMVVLIAAYRHYRSSQQRAAGGAAPGVRKLVVQTGSGDRLLGFDEIEYLESARNYVSVYADGREHLVRDTLKNLLDRLPEERFARTHRRFVVNVDRIVEFRATGSGGHVIVLSDGKELPLGRSHRNRFKSRLAELGA